MRTKKEDTYVSLSVTIKCYIVYHGSLDTIHDKVVLQKSLTRWI